MELYLYPHFDTVYLINGKFAENPKSIILSDKEATYITVLPLSAALLPYTVLLTGKRIASNNALCSLIRCNFGEVLMLAPRYNYIYSGQEANFPLGESVVEKFFSAVTLKKVDEARRYLSPSLSDSVNDEALCSFFDGYSYILPCSKFNKRENSFLLVDEQKNATVFVFSLKCGLIDDVTEL